MRLSRRALIVPFALCASYDHGASQLISPFSNSNSASASAESEAQKDDPCEDLIPQARPVFTWLKAVKNGDQELLKCAFSERLREQFDEQGWDKVLKTYQDVFEKEFGDFEMDDFGFEIGGEQNNRIGMVLVIYKGRKLPGLRVIKQDDAWKIDER